MRSHASRPSLSRAIARDQAGRFRVYGWLHSMRLRDSGLYPIYVRGQAYLAAHQPAEAAAEFQRILDHRSIVLVDPMDAMACLQLARALALSGDSTKAKSAYNDLLALWKNADPKIPLVEEARAEYARLQ